MSASITYNDSKFKELLLYVAGRSVDDARFGKTKLNKILFYVDFLAYEWFGTPVSGATYQRRPYGPVPVQIASARYDLVSSGDASSESAPYMGRQQERLVANRAANMSIFEGHEKDLIDLVVDQFWNRSAVQLSDASHEEPGWRIASERDTIPYSSVFIGSREMTSADIARGQEIWHELQMQEASA